MKKTPSFILFLSFVFLSACKDTYSGNVGGYSTEQENPVTRLTNPDNTLISGADLYASLCASCHGSNGDGGMLPLVKNCKSCSSEHTLAALIDKTMPVGNVGQCTSDCANNIAAFIINGYKTTIDDGSTVEKIVTIKTLPETLRKFSVSVINRAPTPDEYEQAKTEAGFDNVVKKMMQEDGFGEWIKITFNDLLLTDKYQLTTDSMINPDDYSMPSGLEGIPSPFVENNVYFDSRCWSKIMTYSIASEPLELIRYIAENDRPVEEIITANYRMVNYYTQRYVYHGRTLSGEDGSAMDFDYIRYTPGVDKMHFCNAQRYPEKNPSSDEEYYYYDITSFVPAIMPRSMTGSQGRNPPKPVYDNNTPLPLAGILTSEMFLARYETNNTNKNRLRAATVLKYFLDIDVGASQVDNFDSVGYEFPVMQDPGCTACHDVIDPVASAFRNWGRDGTYLSPDHQYMGTIHDQRQQHQSYPQWDQTGMLPPGFNGEEAPDPVRALQWLAGKIAGQTRNYRSAMIRTLYNGLLGSYDNPQYFRSIYDQFETEGIDTSRIKDLVLALIKREDYRINGIERDGRGYDNIMSYRLTTAEILDRKINSLLGFGWTAFDNSSVKVLFGGIDSDAYTHRFDRINGVSEAFSETMAAQMACYATAQDFAIDQDERLLFPFVQLSDQPEDATSIAAILKNIIHLHSRILGEDVDENDEEVQATYDLFYAVYSDYQRDNDTSLNSACQAYHNLRFEKQRGQYRVNYPLSEQILSDKFYTVKAWMAVINYMLLDAEFIHE